MVGNHKTKELLGDILCSSVSSHKTANMQSMSATVEGMAKKISDYRLTLKIKNFMNHDYLREDACIVIQIKKVVFYFVLFR